MFTISVKETYQRTIMSPVRLNFDLSRYVSTIEEVHDNILDIEQELKSMDVIQAKTIKARNVLERRVEYKRPGKTGTLTRTIMVTRYNPPRQAELI